MLRRHRGRYSGQEEELKELGPIRKRLRKFYPLAPTTLAELKESLATLREDEIKGAAEYRVVENVASKLGRQDISAILADIRDDEERHKTRLEMAMSLLKD